MTWQTWMINLTWVVTCAAAILVFYEMLTFEYKRIYIVPTFVFGTTLLHTARAYCFVHLPFLPIDIAFFGIIIPLFTYVFFRISCNDKSMKIILYMTLIYTLGILSHVIAPTLHYLIFGEYLLFDFVGNQSMYASFIATSILLALYYLFYFIWKRYIGAIHADIPNIGAFLFVIGGQLVYIMNELFMTLSRQTEVNLWAATGLILAVIGNLAILHILLTNSKKKEAEESLKEIQHLRELEQIHYASIEARRQEIAKIRHDFNNQLTTAHQLIISNKKEHAEELLNELKQSLANTTENTYSQNSIVNAVLTEKQKDCDSADIKLETEVTIDNKCSISPMHLCSIFTNLLDNAIRTCKLLSIEQRKIELRTTVKGYYLHIKCVNPVADCPEKERSGKGYGKIILSDIASHYSGNFTAERIDNTHIAMMSVILYDAI